MLLPLEVRILEVGIALQRAEGSFYGFAVAGELAATEGDSLISHGTLYKALNRMATAGLLEAEREDAAVAEAENRPRRRLYRLTAAGSRALAAHASQERATSPAAARLGLA